MADFSTLKTNTLDRVGLPSTDGMATSTSLGIAVNAAVQFIGAMNSWPWLYSEQTGVTVAGTETVAIPATCSRVHFVSINADVLDRRQRADLFRTNGGTTPARNTPVEWALKGASTIIVSPIPDVVYTVKFGLSLVEPALSGSTDTPLLPVQFHDFIVVLAAKYIATRRDNPAMVKILDDEAGEWKKILDRAALVSIGTMPPRTRQDWSL